MSAVALVIIAVFTLSAALAAATLRKLMHAALMFAAAFVGLAAFFFLLGAEFLGLVLIFVYVGAVAVLIVFTILLTRHDLDRDRGFNLTGIIVAIAVFAGLAITIFKTRSFPTIAPEVPALTVKQIGQALMTIYIWPLQCVGILLTAALIGALILVIEEKN